MKLSHRLIIAVVAMVVLPGGVLAATKSAPSNPPSGGPMGGPPGGMGMLGPEFQKKHKNALQLVKLANGIGRLDKETNAPLTAKQAKSVLAVLNPLRKSANLDETAAKKAQKAVQKVLTDKQRKAISAMPPERQFRRGGSPPGGPGGGPPKGERPSGPPPGFDLKSFNPLTSPPAGGPGVRQGPNRLNKVFADLEKKSRGK